MKLAIITGASAGIGRDAAQLFIDQGYSVCNISRRECPVEGVENLCGDLSSQSAFTESAERLEALVSGASEVALVHNACRMAKDSAQDCDPEDLTHSLAINVVGAARLNQLLLTKMPSGSSVIYIGSTLSEKAVANSFSYVTSKHAVVGMMRATTQDLAGTGIHSCCICPGFTDTEMLRGHLGNDPEVIKQIGGLNAYNRLIDPKEIAEFIVWAHKNPVINGSVLHAHLGQLES